VHIRHELMERFAQHGPAPDDRLVGFEEKANRHYRYGMSQSRGDFVSAVDLNLAWLAFYPHDDRN
jgi:hypothetical protein